ncbi:eukaryotic translation initiation factor 3, subunit 6 [Pelomyxa schiedti]|nr:eukaryotic translation initiation factor 3, subunit 6 [Pelomyxa schiedti]
MSATESPATPPQNAQTAAATTAAAASAPIADPEDDVAAKYDLTTSFCKYLDPHLLLPMLEFVQTTNLYAPTDVLRSKVDLLNKTNMIDFACEVFAELKGLEGDKPAPEYVESMKNRRDGVINQMREFKSKLEPILKAIRDPDTTEATEFMKLKTNREALEFVQGRSEAQITPANVEILQQAARFFFNCGDYTQASEYLKYYHILGTNPNSLSSALWGELACDILLPDLDDAITVIEQIRDNIETKSAFDAVPHQRLWLIHWAMFPFFNSTNAQGQAAIVDLLFQDKYLHIIQTTCPYILRYLTVILITTKRKRSLLKDLVRILKQEAHTYSDPITQFLVELQSNFDFEAAYQQLKLCNAVFDKDYLLNSVKKTFFENARQFIVESFIRIHQRIDLRMLAQKLEMDVDTTEKWIVDLMRTAHLDAKIDSENKHIIMMAAMQPPNPYQQIIEKTKQLAVRTYTMDTHLGKQGDKFKQFRPYHKYH